MDTTVNQDTPTVVEQDKFCELWRFEDQVVRIIGKLSKKGYRATAIPTPYIKDGAYHADIPVVAVAWDGAPTGGRGTFVVRNRAKSSVYTYKPEAK